MKYLRQCLLTMMFSMVSILSYAVTISVGGSTTLTAPSAGSSYGVLYSWTQSPSGYYVSLGSISSKTCKVTGTRAGTSTIKCTVKWQTYNSTTKTYVYESSNVKTQTYTVTVQAVTPTSISLNYTSIGLQVGETKQLSATVSPSGATQSVTWSVNSGSSYASVSSSGLVTANAAGTAIIRATSKSNSSVYKDCTVTVTSSGNSSYNDGDVFTANSAEGVEMTFKVISAANKTCQVGSSYMRRAIETSSTGSITIPNKVNGFDVIKIDENAFYECSGITSVSIPSSVTSIHHTSFNECPKLASISINSGNTKYDSRNGCNAIIETASNKLIAGCKNTTIPSSVTSIGQYAFHGCSGLTNITIPSSVKSIGQWAFSGCISLKSINIPSTQTIIENGTFEGCSSLTSITIPSSVTSINYDAFNGCTGLTNITIPSTVSSIGSLAFYNCKGLTSITSKINIPFEINEDVFQYYENGTYKTIDATLYVPANKVSAYKATGGWNQFTNIVETGTNPLPTSISLNTTSVSLEVGKTIQLSATVSPSTASQSVTWSVVSGSSYASVSSSGLVTAKLAGTATIRATSTANSSIYKDCTVTVTAQALTPGTWSGNTVTIGGNATSSTTGAPYNNYWTYSTTQMLYSPAEIGKSGTINSIAFKVASTSSFTTTDLKVYLGHKSSIFSSTSDYMTSSNLTLVYSGSPTLGQSTGWETLTFNQGSFNYNGTDNLVVVVATKSSKYNTSLKYYCYAGSGYVLSRGNDTTTGYGDITSTSYTYSTSTERPSIGLGFGQSQSGTTNIEINATNFPDANFRSYLLSQSYGSDGILTQDEINGVTSMLIYSRQISSLKGIEYFTALKTLKCYGNQLTTLDVSKNTALTDLHCSSNQLTTLDVSGNTALATLNCSSNQLTTLDVSGNTALATLNCSSNRLTTLDVSKNTALTDLHCSSNQLTTLDVSKNTALDYLYCLNNRLTTLDVSKNTALKELSCSSNQLTTLDVSKNTALTELYCPDNQLTTLDVSKNTALISLSCYSNQLTTLDVSKNTPLTYLYCYSNQLTTLDVSKNTALISLSCYSNQLTTLDVSKNTPLTWLNCYKNNINGVNMDNLIAGLRQNNTNTSYTFFRVINTSASDEGNVCTKAQVAAVKAKGWTPYYYDGSNYYEYEGSEDDVESLESISLPESIQLSVGETQTLTPVFTPASAAMGVTWSSEDESIATVNELEGIVTAVSPGTTTIYVVADDAEHMASCQVTVTEKVLHDGDTFAANTVEGVKMTYTVISAADKTCQTREIASGAQGTITIPEEVLGFRVIGIGSETFSNCDGLTSVTIPESVIRIDDSAFEDCSGLTSMFFPNSVTTIGTEAFAGCSNLASLTIPESVIYMENYTFDDTPWFDNQPDGLVYAGKVLYDYKGRMPEGTHIDIMEGTLAIAGFAFEKCGNLTSVTIPNSVIAIGYCAFDGLSRLTSVIIGSGVKDIGEEAFGRCSSLTTVTIPKNVESIGENAFYGCSGLTSITSEIKVPFAINKNVFQYYDDNSNTYKPLNATLYVPYGTKVLYEAASGWNQFTNIVEMEEESSEVIEYDGLYYRIAQSDEINAAIGDDVLQPNVDVAVVVDAPQGHKYHGDIVIPDSITYENNTYAVAAIGECAFAEYKEIELTSVVIPNSVVFIGDEAFVESTTLERVEIPNSVRYIGSEAFGDCEALTEIVSYIQEPFAVGVKVFKNIASDATLYVPFGTKILYEATTGWNTIANIVEMEEPNEAIEVDGLYYEIANSDEINVAIGEEVLQSNVDVAVVVEAPQGHKYHGDIVIPASITYENNTYAVAAIGECAFAEYKEIELTSVVIPNSVVYIAEEAFVESSTLERVEIPNSVRYIDEDVFGDCETLTEIVSYIQEPFAIPNDVFRNIANDATLYVPFGTKALYEATAGWNRIANIVEMEDSTEIEDTDISQMDNVVYINSVEGCIGQQLTLSVKMKNAVGIQTVQFDLYLPDGVTVAKDDDGFDLIELSTERTTARKMDSFSSSQLSNGAYRVLINSNNGYTFDGEDGEIALVTVNISPEMAEGDYPLILKDIVLVNTSSEGYETEYVKSTLTVSDYSPGDVNGDGKVNAIDLNAIVNYILERRTFPFTFLEKAADLNGDGKTNAIDVNTVTNMILRGTTPRNAKALAPIFVGVLEEK